MHAYIQRFGRFCWRLASLPAMLLHELTHMILALPWADESAIVVDERGPAHYVNWADGAPRWAIIVASLGPSILGSLVGLIGIWQFMVHMPHSLNDWLLAAAIAGWWTIYVAPSPDDMDVYQPDQRTTEDN